MFGSEFELFGSFGVPVVALFAGCAGLLLGVLAAAGLAAGAVLTLDTVQVASIPFLPCQVTPRSRGVFASPLAAFALVVLDCVVAGVAPLPFVVVALALLTLAATAVALPSPMACGVALPPPVAVAFALVEQEGSALPADAGLEGPFGHAEAWDAGAWACVGAVG